MQSEQLPRSARGIRELLQRAKSELLASPLRKDFEDNAAWSKAENDKDFLYQVWSMFKDEEVWAASPSLRNAFVAQCRNRADDVLSSFDEILSNVDGRNHLTIMDIGEFDEMCEEEWGL